MTTPFKASIALSERLRCIYKKSHTVIELFIVIDLKAAAKLQRNNEMFFRRTKKNANIEPDFLHHTV